MTLDGGHKAGEGCEGVGGEAKFCFVFFYTTACQCSAQLQHNTSGENFFQLGSFHMQIAV